MRGGPEVVTERVMAMNRRYHRAVWPCMEALYDAVYARAFADAWAIHIALPVAKRELAAAILAHDAAAAAVRSFSFKLRDAVIVAKGQQP